MLYFLIYLRDTYWIWPILNESLLSFFFLMWYTYDMHFVDYMYLYVNLFYQFYMQLNMTRPLVAKHVQNIQW